MPYLPEIKMWRMGNPWKSAKNGHQKGRHIYIYMEDCSLPYLAMRGYTEWPPSGVRNGNNCEENRGAAMVP